MSKLLRDRDEDRKGHRGELAATTQRNRHNHTNNHIMVKSDLFTCTVGQLNNIEEKEPLPL